MKKIITLSILLFLMIALSSCSGGTSIECEEIDGGYKVTDIYAKGSSVTIPSSYNGRPVLEIADYALCDNEKITSVTISEGVEKIGKEFLTSCRKLKSLKLPSTLREIDDNFLYDVPHVTKIDVTEGGKYTSVDGVLYTSDMKCLVRFPAGKNIKVFDVPGGITEISNDAFSGAVYIERVAISNSVRKLGDSSFYACEKLKSVYMSQATESIGKYAFADCYLLREIEIPDEVVTIGESAFTWCESIENISIGKKLSAIGKKVFVGCSSLRNIDVSEENESFATLDGHLVSKDRKIFYQCAYARYNTLLAIPQGVERIVSFSCYENKVITTIVIPDSVVTIEDEAFASCDSLTNVSVGSGAKYIGFYAFQGRSLDMMTFSSPEGWEYSKNVGFTKDVYPITLDKHPADNADYFKDTGYAFRKTSSVPIP